MFRTNEIKTNLISSLPPNSFQSLSFYIKDGDYVHFFNDYEKNKIHVNSVDEENNSLLNLAVQCNCPEIVEFLLCKGADPNLQNVRIRLLIALEYIEHTSSLCLVP